MPKGVYDHKIKPAVERFWTKVDRKSDDDCWIWIGVKCKKGYGRLNDDDGKKALAHRFSLELTLGRKLNDGMYALHSCDNPSCVNPSHLREGTQKENMADMDSRSRRNCKVGEQSTNSKLTADQVLEIRSRLDCGSISQYALAKELGISQSTIHSIYHRKKWKHI